MFCDTDMEDNLLCALFMQRGAAAHVAMQCWVYIVTYNTCTICVCVQCASLALGALSAILSFAALLTACNFGPFYLIADAW